ncbi:MAG: hypothetical protein MEQ84_10760 [Mesorhizobium sp.]|nr:hypothetical protein [Mesorhizobium sp.]
MKDRARLLFGATALVGFGVFAMTAVPAIAEEEVTIRMWFNGTPEAHGEVLNRLIPQSPQSRQ